MDVPTLENVVDLLRACVSTTEEWSMLNSITPPAPSVPVEESVPEGYAAFLRIADGVTCGVVTLFPRNLLSEMQFYCDPVEDSAASLDREGWFCCGVVNDEPLFIERVSGRVFRFAERGVPWWMSPDFEMLATSFEEFFLHQVAGSDYPALSPEGSEDDWLEVLRCANRL